MIEKATASKEAVKPVMLLAILEKLGEIAKQQEQRKVEEPGLKGDERMNSDEARLYFKDRGLTYKDISEGDICVLVMILNRNIKEACKQAAMSTTTMRMSEKITSKYDKRGRLVECYLFINSHYFTRREAISFNKDGFIGFCGWADKSNTAPIVKSFLEWAKQLTKTGEQQAV